MFFPTKDNSPILTTEMFVRSNVSVCSQSGEASLWDSQIITL